MTPGSQFVTATQAPAFTSAPGVHAWRTYRLGYLGAGSEAGYAHLQRALLGSLCDLGYVEGENLAVERRFSEGDYDRLEAHAAELATHKPDAVFVIGTQAAVAASRAIHKIPVVFASVAYPVAMGLVRSFAEPGTNATGVANPSDMLSRKRLQLLKEVFPKARQVAVIHNPRNAVEALMVAAIEEAGAKLKLNLPLLGVQSERDFGPVFAALRGIRPDVLYVIESPFNFMHRSRIVQSISSERMAAVYGFTEFAEAGGLVSYSFNLVEHVRSAATFIDKIFRGAKPSELPVEQPTAFELVINLRAATVLGITIPQSVLLRADRVIE